MIHRLVCVHRGRDRFAALEQAVVEAELPPAAGELISRGLIEYEECAKESVEPPPDLVGNVLREYRRLHSSGGLEVAEITSG